MTNKETRAEKRFRNLCRNAIREYFFVPNYRWVGGKLQILGKNPQVYLINYKRMT